MIAHVVVRCKPQHTPQESSPLHRDTLLSYCFVCVEHSDCMYVYVPQACNACGGQTRVSDPLDLELQAVVSHHVSAGIKPGPLQEYLSHLSSFYNISFKLEIPYLSCEMLAKGSIERKLLRSHCQWVCSILTIGCNMMFISETSSMLIFPSFEIRVLPSYSRFALLSERLLRPLWLL